MKSIVCSIAALSLMQSSVAFAQVPTLSEYKKGTIETKSNDFLQRCSDVKSNDLDSLTRLYYEGTSLADELDRKARKDSPPGIRASELFSQSLNVRKEVVRIAHLMSSEDNLNSIASLRQLADARLRYHSTACELALVHEKLGQRTEAIKTFREANAESSNTDSRTKRVLFQFLYGDKVQPSSPTKGDFYPPDITIHGRTLRTDSPPSKHEGSGWSKTNE